MFIMIFILSGFCYSEVLQCSNEATNAFVPTYFACSPTASLIVKITSLLAWTPWLQLMRQCRPWESDTGSREGIFGGLCCVWGSGASHICGVSLVLFVSADCALWPLPPAW